MWSLHLHKQKGFSIAELMVAVTIGLLVTLAVASLFISSNQGYRQNDSVAKMQENARFALELITQDLKHAGFLGNIRAPYEIDINAMSPTAPAAPDCGGISAASAAAASIPPGLYNFTESRQILNFGNQIADVSAFDFYDCIDPSEVKAGSSILLVKRVAGSPTAPLTDTDATDDRKDKTPYIYSNGSNAVLYTHPSAAPGFVGGQHWEYQPRIYFIDSKDTLIRKQLVNLALVPEPLAEGIQAFHIEFGVDTNTNGGSYDGTPDYIYTPDVNSDPGASLNLNETVSATLYILARTTEFDPDTNYLDNKIYNLGANGPKLGPFNDRYHRRVYSTTILLKNQRNQIMMN